MAVARKGRQAHEEQERMSTYHQVFIATEQPVVVLLDDLAGLAGKELTRANGDPVDYSVGVGRDAIQVELRHDFEEDYGIPFERYPLVVTIRDYDRDLVRQGDWAQRVFNRLASTGRYALLLVFDLHELIDSDPPLPGSGVAPDRT
jgi:hypothetical protein